MLWVTDAGVNTAQDTSMSSDASTLPPSLEVYDERIRKAVVVESTVESGFSIMIPKSYQAPLLVLVALLGFLGVLWFSSLSVRRKYVEEELEKKRVEDNSELEETESDSPSPVARTPPRKKNPPVAGSIPTPQGRRSARLMAKKQD